MADKAPDSMSMNTFVPTAITATSSGAHALLLRGAVAAHALACAVEDVIANMLRPMNLHHLEQLFHDNGISGMVFIGLTDVRLQRASHLRCVALTCIVLTLPGGVCVTYAG